jgi:hypothetical protein
MALGSATLYFIQDIASIQSMDPAGPAALPSIIAWLMIAIGAVHIAGAWTTAQKEATSEIKSEVKNEVENEGEKSGVSANRSVRLILFTATCGVYIYFLEEAGYILMTPLLIIAIMLIVGVRSVPRLLGTSLTTTLILFCVFYYALKVDLPLGYLGFLFS